MDRYDQLMQKIEDKTAVLGVIGLGYVGLPLAVAKAQAGYEVIGFDVDVQKINEINKGHSYISDIDNEEVKEQIKEKRLKATNDFSKLSKVDAVSICVPTPIDQYKQPDLSFLVSAVEQLSAHLHQPKLIILSSTTYPGTTKEVVQPMLERAGATMNEDVFLAYSPERIDPGNRHFQIKGIPRIVGGISEQSTLLAARLYEHVLKESLFKVDSTEVAEMAKIVENTFRLVNIGLMNELAVLCHQMKLDIWKVIEAASTKPYGFLPFYPGPGIGGHCIPVDPHYLIWKAKEFHSSTQLIEKAAQINQTMPEYVVFRISMILNELKKPMKHSKILLVGAAYKKNVADLRESPVLEIMELLDHYEADWSYHDPHIPEITMRAAKKQSTELNQLAISSFDLVVITTDHDKVDYQQLADHASVIFDTRNKMRDYNCKGTYHKL